jgi:hypothetical protein
MKEKQETLAIEMQQQLEALQPPTPEGITEALKRRGPPGGTRRPVYWWMSEVATSRKDCLRARRSWTRINRQDPNRHDALRLYKKARRELRLKIRKAKEAAWRLLVQEIDENPWGKGYKIAVKKFARTVPPSKEEGERAVKKLFPEKPIPRWRRRTYALHEAFTEEELEAAVGKLAWTRRNTSGGGVGCVQGGTRSNPGSNERCPREQDLSGTMEKGQAGTSSKAKRNGGEEIPADMPDRHAGKGPGTPQNIASGPPGETTEDPAPKSGCARRSRGILPQRGSGGSTGSSSSI